MLHVAAHFGKRMEGSEPGTTAQKERLGKRNKDRACLSLNLIPFVSSFFHGTKKIRVLHVILK
jgi:hypothetical protein